MSETQALVDDAVTLIVDHAPQSVGQSLREAREARQLPIADIARTLKLSERQLAALEADQWSALPGTTFVRGFVRNYARLLALDAGPLMEALDRQLEKPVARLDIPASSPTEPMAGTSKKKDRSVMLLGLFVLLLAVLGYFLLPGDLSVLQGRIQELLSSRAPVAVAPVPEQQPEPLYPPGASNQELIAPASEAAEDAAETPDAPPGATPALAVTAQPVATQPGAAALTAGPVAPLRFVVSQEAWIEVRDREQKVVFSQRVAAGVAPQVQGQGPLSVTVGYAPGVKLFWRGKPVDLGPHSRGDVARLVLE
ncbi:MAG: helix-turn-helix domain-containing protein [Azonexus sp.]